MASPAATVYVAGRARARVPARTAIVGNPSDGFGGAVIALAIEELSATVLAEPALGVTLAAADEELAFPSLGALVAAARESGYPPAGPLALLMAATARFAAPYDRLAESGLRICLVESSIPGGVGLAGSSAIVIGALRALGELFGERIDDAGLPGIALACEREDLGIFAGLQDRVVQTYGGLLFMEFSPDGEECRMEPLDADRLPPLFVAWLPGSGTDSGRVHTSARERFDRGDPEVVATMREIADLARRALRPLITRDAAELGLLMERNLELRGHIYDLDPRHVEMVRVAGAHGAPANYTGSGGAIVGLYRDAAHLSGIRQALAELGCELLEVR